jgi:hypothetical protein
VLLFTLLVKLLKMPVEDNLTYIRLQALHNSLCMCCISLFQLKHATDRLAAVT